MGVDGAVGAEAVEAKNAEFCCCHILLEFGIGLGEEEGCRE